jgi:AraC-like DNA-binding protein
MPVEPQASPFAEPPSRHPSGRFMWLTPDRVLYAGLIGVPGIRTMGAINVYVAHEGRIRIRIRGGEWQGAELAVVPPYVPHQVVADARSINVLQVEAETVEPARLPLFLQACGAVDSPGFVDRVRAVQRHIGAPGRLPGPMAPALDFDALLFGQALARRRMDARVQQVVDEMKRDPCAPLAAQDCAASVYLSFSRFLHLFKQEIGVPFRSFRTWKRARSLLQHVNREANLAQLALASGYPDSTHFSHSIRQVYGLKPRDIFAGSRRLAIYAQLPQAGGAHPGVGRTGELSPPQTATGALMAGWCS